MAKPDWLRVSYNSEAVTEVKDMLVELDLNTVCQQAHCPNLGECFRKKTATFMIMGSQCTRNCAFCTVTTGKPLPLDSEEPQHLAQATKRLKLDHVVITQVTRDDLEDGGAAHMAKTIQAVHELCPEVTVEVLISDLKGDEKALARVLEAGPHVLNHNVEMVPSLYKRVRPQGDYERSLTVLRKTKEIAPKLLTKTGFMLGLGETPQEVDALLDDIFETQCDILTISQYLAPSKDHYPMQEYIRPEIFAEIKENALAKGFKYVVSGPLVRSSYQAAEAFQAVME